MERKGYCQAVWEAVEGRKEGRKDVCGEGTRQTDNAARRQEREEWWSYVYLISLVPNIQTELAKTVAETACETREQKKQRYCREQQRQWQRQRETRRRELRVVQASLHANCWSPPFTGKVQPAKRILWAEWKKKTRKEKQKRSSAAAQRWLPAHYYSYVI